MALINRDQVATPSLRKKTVTVDALNGDVVVREITLSQRLALQSLKDESEQGALRMLHLVAYSVVDDQGQQLFSPEQWDTFGAQHGEAVNALLSECMDISGYSGEANRKN